MCYYCLWSARFANNVRHWSTLRSKSRQRPYRLICVRHASAQCCLKSPTRRIGQPKTSRKLVAPAAGKDNRTDHILTNVVWKWTRTKGLILALIAAVLIGLVIILGIDGNAYDRWNHANHLLIIHRAWLQDGSPEMPEVLRYTGPSRSRTTFVYTASHMVEGRPLEGLFGHRSSNLRWGTWIISRDGEVFVVDDSGRPRLVEVDKGRATAWIK